MSEQMRKEFEEWAVSQNLIRLDLTKVFGMQRWWYCRNETTAAYTAWQASRQSLVVKLSDLPEASYGTSGTCYVSHVEDRLDEAGVRCE